MLTQRELAEGLTHVSDRFGGCSGPTVVRTPPAKIKGLFRQFPWVSTYIAGGGVERFHVERARHEILKYKPQFLPVGEDVAHSSFFTEHLWLLNKHGEVVTGQSVEIKKYRKYFFFGEILTTRRTHEFRGFVEENSTVGDTLWALNRAGDDVWFILSYFRPTKAVIIYTMPKGVSLAEWVRRGFKIEIAVAASAEKKEAAATDTGISGEKKDVVIPAKKPIENGAIVPVSQEMLNGLSPIARAVTQTTAF